ncbi:unnamed protein product [Ostreobium quekettii]|uniref:Uncharacterized protein n=1 Tax=Ostreobium quekettii TaxID=121088 RepID=A0A8S1JBF1_9CHLO|nr:unnamed protein product [Ostreobium quekettii]|eukprot:evm.model.scf_32EXC.1 EVM.evm.TU.scf_32EXC.1   scf_32EXC:52959-62376(-)
MGRGGACPSDPPPPSGLACDSSTSADPAPSSSAEGPMADEADGGGMGGGHAGDALRSMRLTDVPCEIEESETSSQEGGPSGDGEERATGGPGLVAHCTSLEGAGSSSNDSPRGGSAADGDPSSAVECSGSLAAQDALQPWALNLEEMNDESDEDDQEGEEDLEPLECLECLEEDVCSDWDSSTDDGLPEDGQPSCSGPGYLQLDWQTYSATSTPNHKQVADALCCNGGRCGRSGTDEVVMFTADVLKVQRVPKEGGQELETLSEVQLDTHPYSVDRTPDGKSIAVGGHRGVITFFEVDDDQEAGTSASRSTVLDQKVNNRGHRLRHRGVFFVAADTMVNSVRFGTVAGKQRLVATTQHGYILLFEMEGSGTTPFVCTSLFEPGDARASDGTKCQVVGLATESGAIRHIQMGTAAIGPFQCAVNFAVPSPDGQLLALCLDIKELYLLAEKDGYALHQKSTLSFAQVTGKGHRTRQIQEAGSQYCAFSPSSKYLAATSDLTFSALVWDVASRDLLFHINTNQPSLAISFAASRDELLMFTESRKRLHVMDIRYPKAPHQVVTAPSANSRLCFNLRVEARTTITGLSVTDDDSVYFSTVDRLYKFRLLPSAWSRSTHRYFPAGFKAVVRLMLMAASKDPTCCLWMLPPGTLERVVSMAALPIVQWTDPKQCTRRRGPNRGRRCGLLREQLH